LVFEKVNEVFKNQFWSVVCRPRRLDGLCAQGSGTGRFEGGEFPASCGVISIAWRMKIRSMRFPNAHAWEWMKANIPLFDCPQDNFQEDLLLPLVDIIENTFIRRRRVI
jgi:hypothetical protein